MDLDGASVVELAGWVASGEVCARDVVEHSLRRIRSLDPALNAFAYVRDQALDEARELDERQAAHGVMGPLHGVPVAIKQENDVEGLPTDLGGRSNPTPARADSEVVRRLRAAGAVIVGTTRMSEFGLWPFTESRAFGLTRNPWDPARSPAGSSGGSAAAVAAGLVPAAIGGDGGGSIRLPAAWCGLFGLKAQRGRVSTAPNPDLWRALGVIGPLTRTVADSALIYDVISANVPGDRFRAAPLPGPLLHACTAAPRPLRIVVSATNPMGGPAPDDATRRALDRTAELLTGLGHQVVRTDPRYPRLNHVFSILVAGGTRDEADRVEHPERLEALTRRALRIGRPMLRFGEWAERRAVDGAEALLGAIFGDADLIVMPTAPTPPAPIGQLDGAGVVTALRRATAMTSFTAPWNVLGNPAAAVPAGFTADGLPLSVQVVGRTGGEPLVVALSAQLEQVRPWADRFRELSTDHGRPLP